METQLHIATGPQTLAHAAARDFVHRCQQAIVRRGCFTVCLSGGSTPKALLNLLAQPPYRQAIAWRRVLVFWGDERCVPPHHPDSNFGMAHRNLFCHVPIPPNHVHPIATQGLQPHQAAVRYHHELRCAFAPLGHTTPKFDLLHLGMGDDGHTASLFPHNPLLRSLAKQPWACGVWARHLKSHRITLTPQAICSARAVVFLVSGANKAAPLRQVLQGPSQGCALPSQAIWLQCKQRCTWLVDQAAARFLSSKAMSRTCPHQKEHQNGCRV